MKQEYAEEVAARIIEQLEQGTSPLIKPWKPGELRLPYNPTTGKEYRGMNTLWLASQGHSDPRWMTYNQANNEGAQVRKGSKGTAIVYWKFSDEKKATDAQGNPIIDPETGKQKTINVQLERPRSFTAVVFNASQIDGLPPLEAREPTPEPERHARAEAIMANSGAAIRHERGDRAFYSPSRDSITLPERDQFISSDSYYATALHELGHWTGHPSRLDRDLSNPFGSEGYAREELRAEIASLMLGERLDIGHDPGQHVAYVGSWIKALKEDPKEIFRAASDAEKITGFVMGFEQEQTQEKAQVQQANQDMAPAVAVELQRQHDDANPGYSSMESWQMMQAEAKRNGYTATLTHSPESAFTISYADREGKATGITTELGGDGKMATHHNGRRISNYRSNDEDSQPEALREAIAQHEIGKEKDRQDAQQKAEAWTLKHVTAGTLGNALERGTTAQVEQAQGIVDSMQPLNTDNPFWTRHELPYDVDTLSGQIERATDSTTALHERKSTADKAQAKQSAPGPTQHEKPQNPKEGVTYLAVPFREKDQAKAAAKASGFKLEWDGDNKSWCAPAGADLSKMERWKVDASTVVAAPEPKSPVEQFKEALRDAGLIEKGEIVTDGPNAGKIHRVPVVGDKAGATSGAYAYHAEGRTPGGYIQNYKTGEVVDWKPEGKLPELTAQERAQQAQQAAERKQARTEEQSGKYEATARAASMLWKESPAATPDNAYCKAKGIQKPGGLRTVPDKVSPEAEALGIRIAKTAKEAKALREASPDHRVFKAGDLLIPGTDPDGKLWTLQSVNPYFKSLMKGGRKAGLLTVAGTDNPLQGIKREGTDKASPLVLAEGYATGDTVSRLMEGKPVYIAFDSGNLDSIAKELRGRHPERPLLIAADNDHNAPKQLDDKGRPKKNVGLEKALQAAQAHRGGVMAPQFKDGDKGSDWNDVSAANGDEFARRMLADQMAIAKRDAAVTADRLMTLGRTRDMEARNDPTTSADDAKVATERGHAAETMATAQSQLAEVRSMASDGQTGNAKSSRPVASVKAGIDRKTAAMHDDAKQERQEVQNHAQPGALDGSSAGVSWKKLPEQAKQALRDAVKDGREVQLPKDAPVTLKRAAGLETTPARKRSRGLEAEM